MVNIHEVRFEYERQKQVYVFDIFGDIYYTILQKCLDCILINIII